MDTMQRLSNLLENFDQKLMSIRRASQAAYEFNAGSYTFTVLNEVIALQAEVAAAKRAHEEIVRNVPF